MQKSTIRTKKMLSDIIQNAFLTQELKLTIQTNLEASQS